MIEARLVEDIKAQAREEGESRYALLTIKLAQDKRLDDIQRAATDKDFRAMLFKEYNID